MFTYNAVLYSRILTEVTLAFHILFATIGVGVPLLIALAQWIGIKRNDPHYILLARRWTRGFVITVAVGVVTGTAIGLQLSLLWPNFMELAGQVISLPLFLETFAFFFEAIFLGIYLYTWDRFKNQMKHFLLLIPVVIGSSASALFITIVNAFMNTPQGFELKDGVIVSIQPLVAMFNPAMPTKVGHVLASAYMTSAFVLASIAAYRILRGSKHVYHKKALHITLVPALVFSLATAIIGDFSGKFLAEYQPEKLAAAEWHFETSEKAPLVLFGSLDENNKVKNGITIPYALSILAHNNPNAEVVGLNEFPADELPPLYIHYFFDLMVTIGVLLTVVAFIYLILHKRRKSTPYRKSLLVTIVLSGPLALLAIELGWIFAEVGRQPWILRGYMKTSTGATTADYVDILLICFIALYALLAIVSTIVLRKMFKNNPVEQEFEQMNSAQEVNNL
ncbi:cytochrome ubiquinol oxidase subunit I [Aneurinibacillus aneurinilyticus]|uniref:Bacterial cytochrome ubiquinol oxidase n=1 Tax=Aneurinibacillus aneurinilyticus ATCC 12856 TaxID=649747 RepID=U1WYQ1_ANEAE|nr:cytochrome ubiquinol oxidase subunit I [Aneurinibacillus aneurinilyticus]ERI07795.1 bacterial cytochrome ubiquinol oxidase [Aneurinibacillus aneurinilyticus ATCC 12856]MED0706271.1 cytochrome ubiquinol oxidase subunit I [Aneurinibacillus aneurinilyticus]MED0724226.1 cytochrome ubiquinol oxidase subunit I [Aneurinibacillus aneurinilyticus]MED0732269.1 cytochrome ubiquinol oxidase subunit I [Aneurinibacillus aneurinilyticus]MED0741714.1 cytochrome ubiquinol oxidase subunit I [Aneurinibacillus